MKHDSKGMRANETVSFCEERRRWRRYPLRRYVDGVDFPAVRLRVAVGFAAAAAADNDDDNAAAVADDIAADAAPSAIEGWLR